MNVTELRNAYNDSSIINTCEVAVYKVASNILSESTSATYHAERWDWAKNALNNPRSEAKKLLSLVLIENESLTLEQIHSATLNSFVNNINDIIDGYVSNRL